MRRFWLSVGLSFGLLGCVPAPTPMHLHQIYQRDALRIGIVNGPTSYFEGPDGPTGYEYELAKIMADRLGVKLELVTAYQTEDLLKKLEQGSIDLVASGGTISPTLQQRYRLGPAYQIADEVLVYSNNKRRPKSLDELDAPVVVQQGSSQAEALQLLQQQHPKLQVEYTNNLDATELLQQVAEGKIRYTVTDSHLLSINQRFYPMLSTAITLKKSQPVAWLLPAQDDDSLYTVLIEFFGKSFENADLLTLDDKYFGHISRFNYADTVNFIEAIDKQLPRYEPLFKKYAGPLDWRLLASIAYQESRWDPKVRSPQGVVGMMMLTVDTANLMQVTSRVDAAQSIRGGARYLKRLIDLLPERIPQPDRTWMALAGYNLGLSHIESARMLTEKDGANADSWAEVKQRLPLLRQRKYYRFTRTGYARGDMAVNYVENIRRYYETLQWVDEQRAAKTKAAAPTTIPQSSQAPLRANRPSH